MTFCVLHSEYFEELERQRELTDQIMAAHFIAEADDAALVNKELENVKKPVPNKSPKGFAI